MATVDAPGAAKTTVDSWWADEYGGYKSVHGGHAGAGALSYKIDFTPPNPVTAVAKTQLPVPRGAIIDTAKFIVVVDPPNRSRIGDVADVRQPDPSPSNELVVDFMTMQTVSEIKKGSGMALLTAVHPWTGTEFAGAGLFAEPRTGAVSIAFPEIQTERLLVKFAADVTANQFLTGEAVLPAAPAFVEILINGVRSWFSPIGSASPKKHLAADELTHSFADVIDLTAPLQLALDQDGFLELELRASSPAQLQFGTSPLQFYRTHDVQFADGPTRGVETPTEGVYEIDLPLPDELATETWDVHALQLRLRADIDDTRVQPATGPPLAEDVELVLSESRTLLVKLPAAVLARFGTITGLRVPVRTSVGGGELAGELLSDDTTTTPSRPSDEIPDAALIPVPVASSDAVGYVTMTLATPYEPAPDGSEALWATLRATRGEIAWALGLPDAADDLAGADLRWRAPSGTARYFSAFSSQDSTAEAGTHSGAVRIVGTSDPNRPLDAVTVEIADRPEAAISLTPFETGSSVRLKVEPVSPAEQSFGSPRALSVRLSVAAPGAYTIESARLIYTDPALDIPFEPAGGGTP